MIYTNLGILVAMPGQPQIAFPIQVPTSRSASVLEWGSVLSFCRLESHALWGENRGLAFEGLGYAVAPALGNGLGKAIRENLLFPFSTPSKKATAADSGEAFGQSMPRVISVSTGPVKNGMNRHALAG